MSTPEEPVILGKVVHLVDKALHLEPTIGHHSPNSYVSAAERVLYALRIALEDAGAEDPLAVMADAVRAQIAENERR